MKIKTFLTVFTLSVCSVSLLTAQSVDFSKENFKNDKEGLKNASGNLKEGLALYDLETRGGYRMALEFLLKANRFNPNNDQLNYKIGNCYLNSIEKARCLDHFKKAYDINRNVEPDIHLKLGRGYHLNYKFDEAIEEYNKYKQQLSPKELQDNRPKIDKLIEECHNGKKLVQNPVRVFIDNLGSNINSSYRDYSPLITADESMLIFTSRRENTTGGEIDEMDNEYHEDIYVSTKLDGKWTPANGIGKPLNTNGHDATVGLSPDGQQLFIFLGEKNGGNIFSCELKGNEWSSPDDKTLDKNINTEFHEASASFSFDGKTMYFISNRPDLTYGLHDILISYWETEKKRWGVPKNIGNVINTQYDESNLFMHPDGRTIFFSSQGHNTMGGYDIFSSTLKDDGIWSVPENIGYPINTPDDDLFFVMAANGKHGYYSSAKEGGYGTYDIYMITFLGPEKPMVQSNEDNLLAGLLNPITEAIIEESMEIKTNRLTILKGIITDAFTTQPLEAEIEIVDNEKNEVISTFRSNSSTGKYLLSLPSGKNYGIAVKAEGYLFHSENFNIPATTNYQEISKNIELAKLAKDAKIILQNIFFDYGKATLRPESTTELDRLKKLLTDYPNIRIEISGHTDNTSSLKLNMTLSESRAKAVVDYLIAHGIESSRLEYKGYAYFQPVATNDTPEGRQMNRRVEFKVLSD